MFLFSSISRQVWVGIFHLITRIINLYKIPSSICQGAGHCRLKQNVTGQSVSKISHVTSWKWGRWEKKWERKPLKKRWLTSHFTWLTVKTLYPVTNKIEKQICKTPVLLLINILNKFWKKYFGSMLVLLWSLGVNSRRRFRAKKYHFA